MSRFIWRRLTDNSQTAFAESAAEVLYAERLASAFFHLTLPWLISACIVPTGMDAPAIHVASLARACTPRLRSASARRRYSARQRCALLPPPCMHILHPPPKGRASWHRCPTHRPMFSLLTPSLHWAGEASDRSCDACIKGLEDFDETGVWSLQ